MEDPWDFLFRNEKFFSKSALNAFLVFLGIVLVGRCCCAFIKRVRASCPENSFKLPPGNLGLPVIGETVDFIKNASTGEFFTSRESKYGAIFKTHILGKPTVRISGGSNLKKLFLMESSCLETSWPTSMRMLLGNGCVATSDGDVHKHYKRAVMKAMKQMPWEAKCQDLHDIVVKHMKAWHKRQKLDFYKAAKSLTVEAACCVLLDAKFSDSELVQIEEDLVLYGNGFFTVPVNIPGTTFAKALSAKERLKQLIKDKLSENDGRERSLRVSLNDNDLQKETVLDDCDINLALELLFGGQETVTCAMTCAILLLGNHPDVVSEMRREIDKKFTHDESFTDKSSYESLELVSNVFKEVIRLFPPIGGGFRKAKKTFDMNGYQIPRGWIVNYDIKSTHLTSHVFDDITAFCPDRWDAQRTNLSKSGFSYIPFGAGASSCVGKYYAKTLVHMFLVLLVHTTDWRVIDKDCQMTFVPVVKPIGGLNVEMTSRNNLKRI